MWCGQWLPVSVCPSITSRYCVETADQIELVFDMGAFLGLFCTLCCREVRLTPTIRVLPSAILERYVCGPDTGYLSVRPSVTSRYCVEAAGRLKLEHCRSVRRSVVRTQVTCGRTNRPTTHAHCYPPAQVKLKVAHTRLASVGFRS